ncbi:hypothetical protein E2C01_095363 [Portunus trituberculatus]|uniref:Uncharacterized protein n=1 Tax=Portunus trituberculatus TaxID=210409 RepID=A0A5B7JZZ5_PORTR|nr:hypothetical protein [Portunus trituberculatus]
MVRGRAGVMEYNYRCVIWPVLVRASAPRPAVSFASRSDVLRCVQSRYFHAGVTLNLCGADDATRAIIWHASTAPGKRRGEYT